MFFIKIKVKGYLNNLTENTKDLIDNKAIKNSNIIKYLHNETTHKIIINNNKITLLRENDEFSHSMIFEINKKHKSEYYIKNSNYSLEFNILTTDLKISNKEINITYKILESNSIYNYVLEMSDDL